MQVKRIFLVEQLQLDIYFQIYIHVQYFIYEKWCQVIQNNCDRILVYPHLNKSKETVYNVLPQQHIISPNESHPVIIKMRQISKFIPPHLLILPHRHKAFLSLRMFSSLRIFSTLSFSDSTAAIKKLSTKKILKVSFILKYLSLQKSKLKSILNYSKWLLLE